MIKWICSGVCSLELPRQPWVKAGGGQDRCAPIRHFPGEVRPIVEFLDLLFAGVLAGEELVICYGVRTWWPFWTPPQIQLRHALIRKLHTLVQRVVVILLQRG